MKLNFLKDNRPDWLKGPPYRLTIPENATPTDLLHFLAWYMPKIREALPFTYMHYLILESWMSPEEHENCPFKDWWVK